MISDEWTHDPVTAALSAVVQEAEVCEVHYPDGWRVRAVIGDAVRCGVPHPNDPGSVFGSCGLPPGHESPHSWCWDGWHIGRVWKQLQVVK